MGNKAFIFRLVAVLTLPLIIIVSAISYNEGKKFYRKELVESGHAEYYINNEGEIDFRLLKVWTREHIYYTYPDTSGITNDETITIEKGSTK